MDNDLRYCRLQTTLTLVSRKKRRDLRPSENLPQAEAPVADELLVWKVLVLTEAED